MWFDDESEAKPGSVAEAEQEMSAAKLIDAGVARWVMLWLHGQKTCRILRYLVPIQGPEAKPDIPLALRCKDIPGTPNMAYKLVRERKTARRGLRFWEYRPILGSGLESLPPDGGEGG